jgi:hypothetical protein
MSNEQTKIYRTGEIPEGFKTREFADNGAPDDGEAYLESAAPDALKRIQRSASPRWRVAKALVALKQQVDAIFPGRKKDSDGFIGDEAHCPGKSDHCPLISDNGVGVVAAFDMTHDPRSGCDAERIVSAIVASRDQRIKYIIWNRHIWFSTPTRGKPAWERLEYGGKNPHTRHAHFSVRSDRARYDDIAEWAVPGANA